MDYSAKDEILRKNRRRNAIIFPIYKMFSWDLLCYYSIEFLFLTITKGLSASQVLILSGIVLFFNSLMEILAVFISDFLGRKKSIVLGNVILMFYIIGLMFSKGIVTIVLINLFLALGHDIKRISENNLLYDSVSTRGGDGLYSKIDSDGGTWFCNLDGITSIIAGYLFVLNNYLPLSISFLFLLISTILSLWFKDVTNVTSKEKATLNETLGDYDLELKATIKFIFRSSRMKAFILFKVVIYSLICILSVYRSDLLISIGVSEQHFAVIFGLLTIFGGISLERRKQIEERYKNRVLTILAFNYVFSIIAVGLFSSLVKSNITIIIVLITMLYEAKSVTLWNILEEKYLKNFTIAKDRTKITFAYQFVGTITASFATIVAAIILHYVPISIAYIIVGLIGLLFTVWVLDYMKTRIGLKPHEYRKEDLCIK